MLARVTVVCLNVCLSVRSKSVVHACRATRYYTRISRFNVWSSIKMHGSKLFARNTFDGVHRPSLWRWRAQASRCQVEFCILYLIVVAMRWHSV